MLLLLLLLLLLRWFDSTYSRFGWIASILHLLVSLSGLRTKIAPMIILNARFQKMLIFSRQFLWALHIWRQLLFFCWSRNSMDQVTRFPHCSKSTLHVIALLHIWSRSFLNLMRLNRSVPSNLVVSSWFAQTCRLFVVDMILTLFPHHRHPSIYVFPDGIISTNYGSTTLLNQGWPLDRIGLASWSCLTIWGCSILAPFHIIFKSF